jgi:uracil-DNA glycosylase
VADPPSYRSIVEGDQGRRAALASLAIEIAACRQCPLGSTRRQVVVYRGPTEPQVVFVGEAPGAEEDRQGLPFVGRAGQRLERALVAADVDVSRAGFLNLIKCRPPDNKFDRAAARTCRPFLDRQLALLRPEIVVPLGARALETFATGSATITKSAGRPQPGSHPVVFPLLHPAAPLHDPRLRARFDHDVGELGRFLRAQAPETV